MITAQGGIFGWVADRPPTFLRAAALPRSSPPERTSHETDVTTRRSTDRSAAEPASPMPWWTRGDTNAFFGLGFNMLVNVLVLTGLMPRRGQRPADDVFGTILPALGIALLIGNVYYTFLARRLARRENRTDVTAMPYGPSVPHMFIVVFVIMLPIYLQHQGPDAGLGGRARLGVHHRRDRDDRRVRRAVHPPVHAARRDARHAGGHLDHVHLDAAGRADVGRGLDRACR